jgi:phosphoribosylformylglycinamidine (FGAM) synthase-like enzyme
MSAVVIAVVSFLSGTIGGWWLTMVVVTASISFSQERMQRKVRDGQAETARAEAEAERLARAVIVSSRKTQRSGGDWPHAH